MNVFINPPRLIFVETQIDSKSMCNFHNNINT